MHDIHIPGSPSTPDIHGDAAAGVLAIRGDSYPENSFELFSPVIDWVRAFLADDAQPLTLDLGLVYLNTSSVKAMMDIFDLLEEAHGRQRPVAVRWTYDPRNGQIAELAEEFREDCTFPFEIVPR